MGGTSRGLIRATWVMDYTTSQKRFWKKKRKKEKDLGPN